jgi:hypothetical protein
LPKPIITAFYGNVFFFNNCRILKRLSTKAELPPKINTIAMGIGSLAQFRFCRQIICLKSKPELLRKFEVKRMATPVEKSKIFSNTKQQRPE